MFIFLIIIQEVRSLLARVYNFAVFQSIRIKTLVFIQNDSFAKDFDFGSKDLPSYRLYIIM